MISVESLELAKQELEPLVFEELKNAIRVITATGILEIEKKYRLEMLSMGDSRESDDALAAKVRDYRARTLVLDSFKDLGEMLFKERAEDQ